MKKHGSQHSEGNCHCMNERESPWEDTQLANFIPNSTYLLLKWRASYIYEHILIFISSKDSIWRTMYRINVLSKSSVTHPDKTQRNLLWEEQWCIAEKTEMMTLETNNKHKNRKYASPCTYLCHYFPPSTNCRILKTKGRCLCHHYCLTLFDAVRFVDSLCTEYDTPKQHILDRASTTHQTIYAMRF